MPLASGALVLAPSLGRASPPAAEMAAGADVEALVQRGIELRRAGNDSQALSIFEHAAALAPGSARVRAHLAATHQALGHWLDAEQQLSVVLGETNDPYVSRHRAALEKAYEFVNRRIGSLDVVGEPAGAAVLVNGTELGRLPLRGPAHLPVGSYVLEVRKDGYYALSRPIAITSRSVRREAVDLVQHSRGNVSNLPVPAGPEDSAGSARWLTWTFAGLGAGAGIVGTTAWMLREHYAERWNSDQCLALNQRRGDVCGDVLSRGRTAEGVAYASSVGAGLLLGGALASWLLESSPSEQKNTFSTNCGVSLGAATCSGFF
ncbi:MAG: tetratricopeptide repeat protein [Deltaproteobacteria bacterium]